ncbi:MAG: hypothetical protein QN152_01280 [Armatimonadota bacterium]|nr:hypothetical protein [Armatimonadota bacterium]MDR7426624.1 hypothetical protein [Armatimonadota bacterium]MDR7464058.1 hypothetical protein [Armatimonadota bacterium]MDR7468644.1 hypothetical protein [Armatimonadota bacterium]MDR7473767.1 hypothetical protein [Armatimonadota bacterium]
MHGQLGCTACHGGRPEAADAATAHQGMVGRPSEDPLKACGSCHPDITATFTRSLHFTTRGLERGLQRVPQRAGGG